MTEDKIRTTIQTINNKIEAFLLTRTVSHIMRRIPCKHLHAAFIGIWLLMFTVTEGVTFIPNPGGSILALFFILFDIYIFAYMFYCCEDVINIWNIWHGENK